MIGATGGERRRFWTTTHEAPDNTSLLEAFGN